MRLRRVLRVRRYGFLYTAVTFLMVLLVGGATPGMDVLASASAIEQQPLDGVEKPFEEETAGEPLNSESGKPANLDDEFALAAEEPASEPAPLSAKTVLEGSEAVQLDSDPAMTSYESTDGAQTMAPMNTTYSIGVPRDPEVVFHEDFETDQAPAGSISSIVDYVGDGSRNRNGEAVETFSPSTTASGWGMISECNGTIINYNFSAFPRGTGSGNSAWPGYNGFCTNAGAGTDQNRANTRADMQNNARRFADVLGQVEQGIVGSTNQNSPVNGSNEASRANHAVTEWTSLTPITTPAGSTQVVYRTEQLDLSDRSQPSSVARFYSAGVDVAEASCAYSQNLGTNSRITFALSDENGTHYWLGQDGAGYIEPCLNPSNRYYTSNALPTTRGLGEANSGYGSGGSSVRAGRYYSPTSVLVANEVMQSVSYRMNNIRTAADGNDFAFDNLVLFDATPQLEKTFETNGLEKPRGAITRLTFTVTNTSELAAKQGWSFTDTLPTGLQVAGTPGVSHTCASGTSVSAPAGASAISITNGHLSAGMENCTISVNVVSNTGGDFENCAANITSFNGLDTPTECTTVTYSWLAIDKASTAGSTSEFGDTVTYTVNLKNEGPDDYTAAKPAGITDDLSDVLDDATWNDDATVSFDLGTTGANAPVFDPATNKLTWSGPLKAGETATFTYSVTLNDEGDRTVRNVVCIDGVDDLCDETTTDLPPRINLTIEKSADQTSLPTGTRNVDYTVIVTNHGPAAATGANEVVMVDDLRDVLDDANWVSSSFFPVRPDASYTSPSGSAAAPVFDDATETLTWTGPLEAGQSVEITYRVNWRGTGLQTLGGSGHLYNIACIPEDLAQDPELHCDEVNISGPNTTWKSSDPASGTELVAGDEVTYTLNFRKTSGDFTTWNLDYQDHLGDVLDDADLVPGSITASHSSMTTVFDPVSEVLSIGGSIPMGSANNNETHTVSYTVKVKPDGQRGDNVMANFLMPKTDPPPEACVPAGNELPNCTTHPIDEPESSGFLIEKYGAGPNGEALLPGAGFELRADDNGEPGALVTDPAIIDLADDPTDPVPGRFSVDDLPAGSYWLTETKAPDGHILLAEPVPFTLAADGTITITGTHPQVTADTNTAGVWVIKVNDNPAIGMPLSGGSGTALQTGLGAVMILGAIALLVWHRRNQKPDLTKPTP